MLLSLLVISVHFRCYMNTLLDSLFCGKATAVATVHRTVAKSRLSSQTDKKIIDMLNMSIIFWRPLLDSNQRPAD